jgi:hypothetical protein
MNMSGMWSFNTRTMMTETEDFSESSVLGSAITQLSARADEAHSSISGESNRDEWQVQALLPPRKE